MSLPRPIVPGRIYLITRRCARREFLLRPDETSREIFVYCLAEAAQRFQIEVIGWLAMSNHYHAVVHDPHGRLPKFAGRFHQLLAKAFNVRWSRSDGLWSISAPSYTYLVNAEDVMSKLVYTFLNPAKADLVDTVADWPGSTSWPMALRAAGEITARRPKIFFRADGGMPESVTLSVAAPPWSRNDPQQWWKRVVDAVLRRERQLRASRQARGARVLGRKAVLKTSPFGAPQTPAPIRRLSPFIACKNKLQRIGAIKALKAFIIDHDVARKAFARGLRETLFPFGTFAMLRMGIQCVMNC